MASDAYQRPVLKDEGYRAKVDSTEVSNFHVETFQDMVSTALRVNDVMNQVLGTEDRTLVGSQGTVKRLRKISTLSPSEVNEATAASETSPTHSHVDIDVGNKEWVIDAPLTDVAEENSSLPEQQVIATEIGAGFAEKLAQQAYDTVADSTLASRETFTVGTDGEVHYADATALANSMRQKNNANPDTLVISYDHLDNLVNDSNFVQYNQSNSEATLRRGVVGPGGEVRGGFVGRFNDLEVFATSVANGSTTGSSDVQGVLFDRSRALARVWKRPVRIELERQAKTRELDIVGSSRFKHGIWHENAVGHLINAS